VIKRFSNCPPTPLPKTGEGYYFYKPAKLNLTLDRIAISAILI
jgi:hypothetical protein